MRWYLFSDRFLFCVPFEQVDLPGYGHAVATRHAIKGWLRMIKEYITTREELIRYSRPLSVCTATPFRVDCVCAYLIVVTVC